MPAKPLSPQQKADAARLKTMFKAWQNARRQAGQPASQDAVSELLGFGQSALSQYLNGTIPLNSRALVRFATLLGVAPDDISPSIVEAARREAMLWLSDRAAPAPPPSPASSGFTLNRGVRIVGEGRHHARPKPPAKRRVR